MRCQNIVELNDVFFHLYEGSFIVEHLQHTIKKSRFLSWEWASLRNTGNAYHAAG